ncbi:MAG: HesA/MoeB/ThiF family protein [Alphaproteobacteria bacterium]|nr:HesA/MoeB/ThiF family protein [Alphaproteobacteria bacterium]
MKTCLTAGDERRYARHLVLPEIGESGQQKLLASCVLVVGAGGLGSAALGHLAAAGIGRLIIVEHDRVELSNLQRQLLFETADIGRPKADAARDRLEEINPDCKIDIVPEKITAENARELVRRADIVIDGSDNFETRFGLSEACFLEKKPLVSAAISGFSAQLSTFKPYLENAPCYRCLVPEIPERAKTCAQEGVIGPLAGMMGSMQALEAIRELLGLGSLSGQLLIIDALTMDFRKVILPRDETCPHCK